MSAKERVFIFEIGDCLVSSEILTEYFCCDFSDCKGCCCIIGDSGAPMEREELEILRNEYDNYKEYLTQQGRQELHRQGFGVVDSDEDLVTPLVNNEECAYACFDADLNCYCAIEKSYCNGKTKFKKPISCSLYPIRVGVLSNGVKTLNLHRWIICGEAFKKGRELKIPVYKFLKEPLIKRFGEEFYNALEEAANSLCNKKDNQE